MIVIAINVLMADCLLLTDDYEMGLCYEKEGNKNLAQAAYERILFQSENDIRAKVALSRLFLSMDMKPQVRDMLKDINQTTVDLKTYAEVESLRSKSLTTDINFKAHISLNQGEDSNINASRNSAILDDLTQDSASETSTSFTRFSGSLELKKKLDYRSPWYVRAQLNYFSQANEDHASLYDITYTRTNLALGYKTKKWLYDIPIFYDYLNYLGRDLLDAYGIRPKMTTRVRKGVYLSFNGLYQIHQYVNTTDQSRDDKVLGLGSDLIYLKDEWTHFFKAKAERYMATSEVKDDFIDKWLTSLHIGSIYKYSQTYKMKFTLGQRYLSFDETSKSNKRDDYSYDLLAGVEYSVSKKLTLHGAIHYLSNHSNYSSAVYDKQEISVGLRYRYEER